MEPVCPKDPTTQKIHLIETDKTREHEDYLTAIDYHRNLNLIVTSCAAGQVKLWSTNNMRGLGDKCLIREINFPNRVDSVCFLNEAGDLLVGHEKRLSVIKFRTYWPFRDEKGVLDTDCTTRDRLDPVKRNEIKDQLFLNMKKRDDGVRGNKLTQAEVPAQKRASPNRSGSPGKRVRMS